MSKSKLSILLIKKDTPADMIIKQLEGVHNEQIAGCQFYYKHSFTSTPKWVDKFFNNQLACSEHLKTTSAAGVLLVERTYDNEQRVFAVCFGYGHSLLIPTCIEERFGLITTLNTVNPRELRSLDISRLDTNALKSRIQSSKLAAVADFEFDVDKSLLRQATGLSSDEEMGKSVSGSDSFTMSVEADLESIGEVLDRCYTKYKSEEYRGAFSWIEHIMPLKKGELIETLDALLLERIQDENDQSTWLAVPDIIDWEGISILKFEDAGEEYDDILIETFRREVLLGRELTLFFLKHRYVSAYNANGELRYRWPYYKCLYSEIEHNQKLYMLNAGSWYQVENGYKTQIEKVYDNAPLSDLALIDYNQEDEGAYNEALAHSSPSYCLMDKNLIPSGTVGNGIEFCDVYDRSGKMIHVKKYGGSQVLGHLFNQGLVSARMLFDQTFRREVNSRLPDGWGIPMDGFNPRSFEVIYGIISKKHDIRPHIPFFSKVVFHDIYQTLSSFGYEVKLKAIYNTKQ